MDQRRQEILGDHEPSPTVETALLTLVTGAPAEVPAGVVIPADVLRRACLAANGEAAGRLCLRGGRIAGDFDLTGLRFDLGLRFEQTEFDEIVLTDTRLLALELEGGSAAEFGPRDGRARRTRLPTARCCSP